MSEASKAGKGTDVSELKEKKKMNKIVKILLIVIAQIILVVIVFCVIYFVVLKNSPAKLFKAKAKPPIVLAFNSNSFLVNLADTNAKVYLKISVVLSYDSLNKKLATELDDNKSIVKDSIIGIIKAKKSTEINTAGIEVLKTQILKGVNADLKEGKVINVYYDDILVQ